MLELTNLPNDIKHLIYVQVLSLRENKKVLSKSLKEDIESYPLIYTILDLYHSIFSQNFLDWLENDILGELNDNIALMDGFSEDFMNVFPGRSVEDIMFEIIDETHDNGYHQMITVKKYWRHLSPLKRYNLLKMNISRLESKNRQNFNY